MEKNGIWHSSFYIPAFLVNSERDASITTVCNLLQEVAGQHALHHQLGYENMLAKKQFWVLNRLRVNIQSFPTWRSNIEVQTWVSNMKGPFSYRNFAIYNQAGELLIAACSLWVLLDAKTRRPIRVAKHSLPVLEEKESICGQPDKLGLLFNDQLIGTHRVKYSDLDMIKHVNNSKYIEWLMDRVDKAKRQVHQLDVNYLKESFLEDEIEFYANGNNFALRKKGYDNDVCRIRLS